MDARILFLGDLRLGRRPLGLPDALAARGLDPANLGPGAAWRATVDAAIRHRVTAVVLAGSLAARKEHRFEAVDELAGGLARLADAGIPCFAVAAGSDRELLRALAGLQPGLRVLGLDGTWECSDVCEGVTLAGRCTESADQDCGPPADAPEATLMTAPGRAAASGDGAWRQLGTVTSLGRTEPGPRGPWEALAQDGVMEWSRLPLAVLRWEPAQVPIEGLDGCSGKALREELARRFLEALDRAAESLRAEGATARAVGCLVALTGTGRRHLEALEWCEGSGPRELRRECEGVLHFVGFIEDRASAGLDLNEIAQAEDLPGLLARNLLALERGDAEVEDLLADANRHLQALAEETLWHGLDKEPEESRDLLLRAGRRALEALVAQSEQE